MIDDVKDSINDTKSKVVKAVDDAELDKRAKELGDAAGDKLKDIDIQKMGTELFDTVSKGAKEGASFVSQGLKDNGNMFYKGAKEGAESFKKSVEDFKDHKEVSLDDQLHDAVNKYNAEYAEFEGYGSSILRQRERSVDVLNNVEILINSIANHPKSFDVDLQDIQVEKKKFRDVCDYAVDELSAAKKSALSAGAGLSCGVAVASLAPSAAMWVATTFGTASTGTAISALSGAAATSAKLAWLGGGALAAGGGGMAAGNAFLALAGPVGWSISGATLLASVVLFANKKMKLGKEKKEEIEAVLRNVESIKEINYTVKQLLDKTAKLREMLNSQYGQCMPCYGKNFLELSENQQMLLGTLVNNAKSLAATLSENVEV